VAHLHVSGRLSAKGSADSGDLGHQDSAGRFFVDGRADDLIVTGGENVFPIEVENALLSHPAVADARVVGVPDEEYGALLEAHVVRREPVDAWELLRHARARLSPAKVPRSITFVAELPVTSTGKPARRVT
jgi:acyl-CoA synthetase (AMP-forming)/AMP-acid ligase II